MNFVHVNVSNIKLEDMKTSDTKIFCCIKNSKIKKRDLGKNIFEK